MKSIKIENAGPIGSLDVPIPEGGGVVVFRGPNGGGKSIGLRAIRTLVEGPNRTTFPRGTARRRRPSRVSVPC